MKRKTQIERASRVFENWISNETTLILSTLSGYGVVSIVGMLFQRIDSSFFFRSSSHELMTTIDLREVNVAKVKVKRKGQQLNVTVVCNLPWGDEVEYGFYEVPPGTKFENLQKMLFSLRPETKHVQ